MNLLIYRNMGVRIFLFDNYHHLPCPVREGVEAEQGNGVWVDGQDDEDAAHKVHHHAGLKSTIKIVWYKCSKNYVRPTKRLLSRNQPTGRKSNQRIDGHDGSRKVKLPLPIIWSRDWYKKVRVKYSPPPVPIKINSTLPSSCRQF